jgi:hypothetical protein
VASPTSIHRASDPGRKPYCSAVIDAWPRRVVGWSIDRRPNAATVNAGSRHAVAARNPRSDRWSTATTARNTGHGPSAKGARRRRQTRDAMLTHADAPVLVAARRTPSVRPSRALGWWIAEYRQGDVERFGRRHAAQSSGITTILCASHVRNFGGSDARSATLSVNYLIQRMIASVAARYSSSRSLARPGP